MGCENLVWSDMRTACTRLDRDYHATRIENAIGAGFPDVDACLCGIEHSVELKGIDHWKKTNGIYKLDHELRETQRRWHKARWLAGGNNWIVVGVRNPEIEWWIWQGDVGARVIDRTPIEELKAAAALSYIGPFPTLKFLGLIRNRANRR